MKTHKDEAAKVKHIQHSVLLRGTGSIFLVCFVFFALQKVHKQRYRSGEYTGRLLTTCLIVWRVITHSYGWLFFFFSQITVKDKQPCVRITVVKHFKPQDHIRICIDLIPKNKAPLKSAWLPSELVQPSSGRPSPKASRALEIMRVDCPRWPVPFSWQTTALLPRDVEKPLVTAETGL